MITRHAITNYGSLLQAIATQQAIESIGHICEIIDYKRKDENYLRQESTLLKNKSDWNNNVIKKIFYMSLRWPESVIAGRFFEKLRLKYLKMTKSYVCENDLKNDKPHADVFMTGSDQVWGPVTNGTFDPNYCLSFTENGDKLISYASSFGRIEFNDNIKEYYNNWLSRYKYISVRENSAKEFLNKIGITAQQVIDPTLLFDKKYWKKFMSPIPQKKYILVYQLHKNKDMGEYAKKVSDRMNLPLIRISPYFHQFTQPGRLVYLPGLGEFLSYINEAECLITDSFHGTAFAVNFNKNFVNVITDNETATRNISILNLTHLSNRIVKNKNDIDLALKKIDFSYANKVLKTERKNSLNTLKNMIEN